MKAYSKVTAVGAALLFVGALAGTALAIEAFSERFEEDFSQPRTILARIIVVDPYEDAVWVNWVWKGVVAGGSESVFPGQPKMTAQPGFPTMKSECGTIAGLPGVPTEVLGEDQAGGSLKYGKHVLFKHLPPGCTGEAPKAGGGH